MLIDYLKDVALECRIYLAKRRFLRIPGFENRDRFLALIRKRSPAQVRRMECRLGLTQKG